MLSLSQRGLQGRLKGRLKTAWDWPVLSESNSKRRFNTWSHLWCSGSLKERLPQPNDRPRGRKDMKPGCRCCGPATLRLLWLHGSGAGRTRPHTEGTCTHIQTQRSNWCHISCQYSKFFLSSTPTKGSSLFNIMKPQREAAGWCRSIWRRHRWLPGHTLDPSNWLWRQREMDKWEAPPEWPDDWGRNKEACWASHGNPEESQGLVWRV